jgi:hypothetical protein
LFYDDIRRMTMNTQLLGESVRHSAFGQGTITEVSGEFLTIRFAKKERRFIYPDAFLNFLTLKDDSKQKAIIENCNRRQKIEEVERRKICDEIERLRQIRTMKIAPNSQAAFHIEYDGAERIIGSRSVSTGCYLSGESKGKPRIPQRVKPNSACLLTGVPANGGEKDRRILGVLMAKEDFWGAHCKDGHIEGHEKHGICLPADMRMSYWDYFEHGDSFPRWGNVVYKYFSNDIMQRILFDMAKLLSGTQQGAAAKAFYDYFCGINRLSGFIGMETGKIANGL